MKATPNYVDAEAGKVAERQALLWAIPALAALAPYWICGEIRRVLSVFALTILLVFGFTGSSQAQTVQWGSFTVSAHTPQPDGHAIYWSNIATAATCDGYPQFLEDIQWTGSRGWARFNRPGGTPEAPIQCTAWAQRQFEYRGTRYRATGCKTQEITYWCGRVVMPVFKFGTLTPRSTTFNYEVVVP